MLHARAGLHLHLNLTWLHHLAGLLLHNNDLRRVFVLLASVAVVPAALLAKDTAAAEAAEKDANIEADKATDVDEPQGDICHADSCDPRYRCRSLI